MRKPSKRVAPLRSSAAKDSRYLAIPKHKTNAIFYFFCGKKFALDFPRKAPQQL